MNLPGFGPEQQEALNRAKVLVIGAGGLGCPVMQTLAATGVGHISLIDDDVVDLTNIHRQILFGASDVGRKKTEAAAERLRELQPGIEVTTIEGRMNASNAIELLDGIDVLIDGSDTFTTKFMAADAAEITGTPLMWGSVLRYRGDVALWWSGPGAPTIGGVAGGVGMRDLYPAQPDPDSVPDCATAGVLGVTTSVVGGLMSTEAVKFLARIGDADPAAAVGQLHMYDALSATLRRFQVRRDPHRAPVTELGDYLQACAVSPNEGRELIDALERGDAAALDVREVHEKALSDLPYPGAHLPLSEADRAAEVIGQLPTGDVVVYCAAGARSARFVDQFADLAAEHGVRLHSLPGGTNRWAE